MLGEMGSYTHPNQIYLQIDYLDFLKKTMNIKELLRFLCEPILINGCSTYAPGLYSGKAGYALALFMANTYLDEEYIEQRAYDLLRESLLAQLDNISFEDGLSGIGFALLFLIRNDFIEATFEELFDEQHQKIIQRSKQAIKKGEDITSLLKICYYLQAINPESKYWKESRKLLEKIISLHNKEVRSVLLSFTQQENKNSWIYVSSLLETSLEVQALCHYSNLQISEILEIFSQIYKKGRVTCSHVIGYYMNELDTTKSFQDTVDNILVASSYIRYYPELGNIKSHIEADKIWGEDAFIHSICTSTREECEHLLNMRKEKGFQLIGYEKGISRLVMYLANKKIQLL